MKSVGAATASPVVDCSRYSTNFECLGDSFFFVTMGTEDSTTHEPTPRGERWVSQPQP